MLNTFSRTRRAILVAAAGAVLAAGPAATIARAADNTGPVDPGQTRATPEQCDMYQGWYSQEWWSAWQAYSDGNATAGNQFMQDAQYSKNLAAQRGCTWAQRRLPSPASPVLPVGAPGHTLPPINPGPASPVQPVSASVGALPPTQG